MIDRTFTTPTPPVLDLAIPQGVIEVDTVDREETHVVLECQDESALEEGVVELRETPVVAKVERRPLWGGMINTPTGAFPLGGRLYTMRGGCPAGTELRANTAAAD